MIKPKYYLHPDDFNAVVKNTPLIAIDLVVVDDDRVLVGKRVNRPAKGFFFVPGGRICKGERFDEAFSRISLNELGVPLTRDDCDFIGIYDHMYDDSANDVETSTHYVVSAFKVNMSMSDLDLDSLATQHETVEMLSFSEALSSEDVHDNTKIYVLELLEEV